jgi:hypothetical protein
MSIRIVATRFGIAGLSVTKEDLGGNRSMQIKAVTPLQGAKDLYILIVDAANYFGGQQRSGSAARRGERC